MRTYKLQIALTMASLFVVAPLRAEVADNSLSRARQMFQRLTISYSPDDESKIHAMATKIAAGKPVEAASIATAEARFIDEALLPLGLRYSSQTGGTSIPYNSVVAMLQLITRAGIDPTGVTAEDEADNAGDIRQWLYGRFAAEIQAPTGSTVTVPSRISADDNAAGGQKVDENKHFAALKQNGWSAKAVLQQARPQYDITGHRVDYAGLFTLGGMQHLYIAGTNRRPVAHTFERFLCRKMEVVHDLTVPDGFVRGDVDHREPQYSGRCVGCHGILDGLSPAFAFLTSANNGIRFLTNMDDKYKRNAGNYPDGYKPYDLTSIPQKATWANFATTNQNATLGWNGPTNGLNVREYGLMISRSDAFLDCLAQNVWQDVCRRPMSDAEKTSLTKSLVDSGLRKTGFRLHKLYEVIAANPTCIGGL